MNMLARLDERDAFAELSCFRTAFYGCLSARADTFFELTDALLCADVPTRTPMELSLLAEHQRGFVAAVTSDRTSWTAMLDAVLLGPEDDAIAVTARQLRQVKAAGQARTGVPPGEAGDLAGAGGGDRERHALLREGRGPCAGPGPPSAHPPLSLDRSRRRTSPG
ncbi:hypothetical protein ACPCTO_34105 [Streptomyces olivoreticuli]